jgi:hypothetical protein
MQRIIRWAALALVMLSLNSCGIPGALARSATGLVQGVETMAGPLIGPAMTAAAL